MIFSEFGLVLMDLGKTARSIKKQTWFRLHEEYFAHIAILTNKVEQSIAVHFSCCQIVHNHNTAPKIYLCKKQHKLNNWMKKGSIVIYRVLSSTLIINNSICILGNFCLLCSCYVTSTFCENYSNQVRFSNSQ